MNMADVESKEPQTIEAEAQVPDRAEPIQSRFLFVDVAAQRAKQLRRGVVPRVPRDAGATHKLERVAMEEVRQGLIQYQLPPTPGRRDTP
jgi:DNA-directed RNA polymerase omega subunit